MSTSTTFMPSSPPSNALSGIAPMNGTVTRDNPAPPIPDNGPDALGGAEAALTNITQHVFSNALAVSVDVRNKDSDIGLRLRPASEQSVNAPGQKRQSRQRETLSLNIIQKVGIMTIFAPAAMSSLNASGNAKSQQIRKPTGPIGVLMISCGSCFDDVR
jgi:hypothetical protein